eukprot:2101118-Pleurochrysis_carterae.AAC.1
MAILGSKQNFEFQRGPSWQFRFSRKRGPLLKPDSATACEFPVSAEPPHVRFRIPLRGTTLQYWHGLVNDKSKCAGLSDTLLLFLKFQTFRAHENLDKTQRPK